MRVRHIALQDFRNVALCALDFDGARAAFVGANGQGKTNLLEAMGLAGALRSFRTRDTAALVRRDADEARVLLRLEHEHDGETEVEIRLRAGARSAFVNTAHVARLADFIGRFPFVVLCSDDIRLLRGAPAERRRPFDLLFSTGSRPYFDALRRHERALKSRNALLKAPYADDESCAAFEEEMAAAAETLCALRAECTQALCADLRACYAHLDGARETPNIAYAPCAEAKTRAQWRELFRANRPRERLLQTTLCGAHRDDYQFLLDGHLAADYASEGQQRGLVVAWRLAQAHWLHRTLGAAPVLLADDVLGELDDDRKRGFWRAIPAEWQVFATGTELPDDATHWQVWRVEAGNFALSPTP